VMKCTCKGFYVNPNCPQHGLNANPMPPEEQWAELKKEILRHIESIDGQVKWSEVEPEWWCEMSDIRRMLHRFNARKP
jgi:rubredoxin